MQLIAGLGNPGPKYAGHRHNVGFMVLDELMARAGSPGFRKKFQGEVAKAPLRGGDAVLLKPLTFMNLSGRSVQQAMRFYQVPLESLVVIHDELDLPFGGLRIKVGGGTAGHNGLRSIVRECGGPGFIRLRIGIGRPRSGAVEGYVLSDFDKDQRQTLPDVLQRAADAVDQIVAHGVRQAMNELN